MCLSLVLVLLLKSSNIDILVPLDNYISGSTMHFLTWKEPDCQQRLWNVISSIVGDKNLVDNDIEPAPKLIEFGGQVDHWVEPYIRITVERLHLTERPYLKCLLMQVIADALYYNTSLTLNIFEVSLCLLQSIVPLGSVEELLATYVSQRRELPPPVTVWEWGWTKSAETWNGRAAMLEVLVLLLVEVTTGEGFLHQWGILPVVH